MTMKRLTSVSGCTIQPVKWVVFRDGEGPMSNGATFVEIDDEGAGGYVKISQSYSPGPKEDGEINIAPDEWPAIREAVDAAFAGREDS